VQVFDRVMVKVEGEDVQGTILAVTSDNKGAEYEVMLDDGGTHYYRDTDWMRKLPTVRVGNTVRHDGKVWLVAAITYNATAIEVRAKLTPAGEGEQKFANVTELSLAHEGGVVASGLHQHQCFMPAGG